MLGKKRMNNRRGNPQIKHKSTKDKLSHLPPHPKKSKKNTTDDLDESIKSDSDIESIKSDIPHNDHINSNKGSITNTNTPTITGKGKENNFSSKILENTDEKNVRLAKQLLQKLDKKDKRKKSIDSVSSASSDNEERNLLLKEKIAIENNKSKVSFWSNESFDPYESSYIKGHHSTITDLAIASDSSFVVTSSKDTRGILFDLNANRKLLLPQFTKKALNCVALSPDNKRAFFGGKDKSIYSFDLVSMRLIQKLKAHNEQVTGILYDSVKEQFYSIANDHLLKVWSGEGDQSIQLETFYGHTSKVNCIENMPGELDRILTCGMDNSINLWKVEAQSFVQFKITDLYPVDCITAINQDYYLSGNFNGEIDLWKTDKKKCVKKHPFAHGYHKDFMFKHRFFDNYEDYENPKEGINVKLGNPILSLGCVPMSDMFFSGSSDGTVNFYKFDGSNEDIFPLITKEKTIKLSSKGCINAIKANKTKDMIVAANGIDGKKGRMNVNYNAKLGITIIKLFN